MQEATPPPYPYRWAIAAGGFLTLFGALGIARFGYGLLVPSLQQGLSLDYQQIGLISTSNFSGYLLSILLVSPISHRLQPRLTILLGMVLITASLYAIPLTAHYSALLLLYGITGLGSGLANIPLMVLVSHWFPPHQRGLAAGLVVAGNGSAILLSGLLLPGVMAAADWSLGWQIAATTVALVTVGVALLLRNEPTPACTTATATQSLSLWQRQTWALLLWIGLLYLIFGATYTIYTTFLISSMIAEYALDAVASGRLWALLGLFSLFSAIGFGTLSDRWGRLTTLALVFLLQSLAYLLVALSGNSAVLLASLCCFGITAFAVPTIIASSIGERFGRSLATQAFAAVTLLFALGQVAGPVVAGSLAESSGSFQSSYLLSAALTLLATLLAYSQRRTPQ
jgi:MFS family permease